MRKKFTVADYHAMLHAGIFSEDDRVELIDGEIRQMSAVDTVHAESVNRLSQNLARRIGDNFVIAVQNLVTLNEFSEPEPDITILQWRDDYYEQQHPTPADILIVIEVGNTPVVYDQTEKLPRYAAAGIPEVWLIDVARRMIEQYANNENGQYQIRKVLTRGMVLQATIIPDLALTTEQIFGL